MSERICLIVDDEPAIRILLRTILTYRNFQSVEAESAAHALSIVQKLSGGLDLIVSEISTSGDINGLDLADSIQRTYPAIPVILISRHCDEYVTSIAGFDFIPKPFVPKTILNAVDRAISLRPERAFHTAGGHH